MSYKKVDVVSVSPTDAIDKGLRAFMLGVYNNMVIALVITGLVAWFASTTIIPMVGTIGAICLAFLPLLFIFPLANGIYKYSIGTAYVLFWVFSAVMGLSLSMLLSMYTVESLAKVFFISGGTFATASIYGYVTKKDLTSMGGFMMMGLIGIIIASIVNIFMASSLMSFVISGIAVLVFVGLTAFDTQKLKDEYLSQGAEYGFDSPARSSIYGALTLYLDFINLFVHLLNLLGDRK